LSISTAGHVRVWPSQMCAVACEHPSRMVSWAPSCPLPKWRLDRFIRFCNNRHTDRPTAQCQRTKVHRLFVDLASANVLVVCHVPASDIFARTYTVAQKVVHCSTRHIFGTIRNKMKQISPKCSESFWEQRFGCSFYVAVNYFVQISFFYCTSITLLPTVELMIFFAIAM